MAIRQTVTIGNATAQLCDDYVAGRTPEQQAQDKDAFDAVIRLLLSDPEVRSRLAEFYKSADEDVHFRP